MHNPIQIPADALITFHLLIVGGGNLFLNVAILQQKAGKKRETHVNNAGCKLNCLQNKLCKCFMEEEMHVRPK